VVERGRIAKEDLDKDLVSLHIKSLINYFSIEIDRCEMMVCERSYFFSDAGLCVVGVINYRLY